jgi:hypothetical protein
MKIVDIYRKSDTGVPFLLARLLDLLGLSFFNLYPIPYQITRRSKHEYQKRI